MPLNATNKEACILAAREILAAASRAPPRAGTGCQNKPAAYLRLEIVIKPVDKLTPFSFG
jgi:hypothetical protein